METEKFKLTNLKTFLFGMILMNSIHTIKMPSCVGGPCEIAFISKIISFFVPILLPGTSNLFSDNGFFLGYKTYGLTDAIPQLIVHIGVDVLYWYLIICLITRLYRKFTQKN